MTTIPRIGLGLDQTIGATLDDQTALGREAAELGYASLWTPDGKGMDGVALCLLRWHGSAEAVEGGIETATGVTPVSYHHPVGLATSAATVAVATGGRFILGIGSRGLHRAEARAEVGMARASAIGIMDEYLTALRALLAGEKVRHHGDVVTVDGVALDLTPPRVPTYLAAMGPQMLRLAGRNADGVVLNWATPDHVSWSRARIAEGAAAGGRSADDVALAGYIRVSVGNDHEAARRGAVAALLPYALGPQLDDEARAADRRYGYRAHFDRLGFGDALNELHRMRNNGASSDRLAAAFPDELLRTVCYYGPTEGAAERFAELAEGLDTAIVRVVAPDLPAARQAMRALAPDELTD